MNTDISKTTTISLSPFDGRKSRCFYVNGEMIQRVFMEILLTLFRYSRSIINFPEEDMEKTSLGT